MVRLCAPPQAFVLTVTEDPDGILMRYVPRRTPFAARLALRIQPTEALEMQ